ncbi:MAG: ribonuclease III [Burkholderiales bacterium]
MDKGFGALQSKIGYSFSDEKLLARAFVHSSADTSESYERLEFLGDAVLELVISELIFSRKPEFSEGELTKTRAAIVNEGMLVAAARELDLGKYLVLGRGEKASGGAEKPSILADAVEALFGAVYLDGGFENAKNVVETVMSSNIETVLSGGGVKDYKTRLQEHFHKRGITDIKYTVYKEEGPPHDKLFYVKLYVNGVELSEGKGGSKKNAEQRAAKQALLNI